MACIKAAPATNCCSISLDFVSEYDRECFWPYWSSWHGRESLSLRHIISYVDPSQFCRMSCSRYNSTSVGTKNDQLLARNSFNPMIYTHVDDL